MIQLSKLQLMLLEQIVYIKDDVFQAAGIDSCPGLDELKKGTTLKEFLDAFNDNALKRLEAVSDEKTFSLIKGREMAAIIRHLKRDPELMQIQFIEKGPQGAYCFRDISGHAIVAFRGTSNPTEMIDNVEGLWNDNTEAQKTALNYIESLPYEEVSVIGHSKGGNKAMYVTLFSDKVDYCLSLDSQGFSPQFLNRYAGEVRLNAHKIHNDSLDHDMVHSLLIQPEGSHQSYYQGSEGLSGVEVHSPSAFFHYTHNEYGETVIQDSDGEPILFCSEEGEEISAFHDYQSFLLHFMPSSILSAALNFASRLALLNWTKGPKAGRSGFNAVHYAFRHPRRFGSLIAYLMHYIFIIKPPVIHITSLISALGLREMIALFEKAIADFSKIQTIEVQAEIAPIGKFENLIRMLYKVPCPDLMRHPLFPKFMGFSEKWLQETLGIQIDTSRIGKSIEEAHQAILVQQGNLIPFHIMFPDFKKYDYTFKTYLLLKNTIRRIMSLTSGSIAEWNSTYASESWYSDLGISLFVNGIQAYGDRLETVNTDCLLQIERIFHQVWQIDMKNAHEIRGCRSGLNLVNAKMRKIAGQIGQR